MMSLAEEIMNELKALPDAKKQEVLDFTRYLRIKEEVAVDRSMDAIIENNLEAFKELAK